MIQINSNNHFKASLLLALFFTIVVSVFILLTGKTGSFQLINSHHHSAADFFFRYFTHAGDGWMWVPVGLYFIFFRRKYLVAILAGIIISSLLTQFLKRVIYPDELRPIEHLSENFPVHVIEGLKLNRIYSFPSGHTSTAFAMALILAYMFNKKSLSIILPVLALLVGYSRVYLAQHFLTDVLAGMGIGIISALLSLMIYRSFLKYLNKKATSKSEIV